MHFGIVLPFLKGGNSAFTTAIEVFFKKMNIGHSDNYCPIGPNRKKMGFNY